MGKVGIILIAIAAAAAAGLYISSRNTALSSPFEKGDVIFATSPDNVNGFYTTIVDQSATQFRTAEGWYPHVSRHSYNWIDKTELNNFFLRECLSYEIVDHVTI